MQISKLLLPIMFCSILVLFYFINPATHFFPRCPLLVLTGLRCPGCGSQRALYCILHGQWRSAFLYNPLMVIGLPYVVLGILRLYTNFINHQHWFIKAIFGGTAITIIVIIIVAYFIARNVFGL